MTSEVYFIGLEAKDSESKMECKLEKLFDAASFGRFIKKGDFTAVKIHFGSSGNRGFVHPWDVRPIVDKIIQNGGKPFLTDTTTLYVGDRKNAVDHQLTALKHGFGPMVVNAPIIIADGLRGKDYHEVEINRKHFKKVKIASAFIDSDAMIVISHFKGHMMAGFGGAIKNLAMGCASAQGKKDQHTARPVSDKEFCTGCGTCLKHCPADAIKLNEKKAEIDPDLCIGCGECMIHCPEKAINLDWSAEIPEFTERLTEHAYGAYSIFPKKIGFINFVINVTPDCDCLPWSDVPIVEDIGILASKDPVALDKACYDLVNQKRGKENSALTCNHAPGEDKFKAIYEGLLPEIQFNYGTEIGMGNKEYKLIKLDQNE
jgi:uncharacterized Fe-S center protein